MRRPRASILQRVAAVTPAIVAAAALVAGCGGSGDPLFTVPVVPTGAARSHVVVLVMENKEEDCVLGVGAAPVLNRLARRGGTAAASYGVTHPSLPNYVALVSGSTQGITDDCTDGTANAPNLADQLERAHRSWRAYLGGPPAPCARPATAGRYAKKHDPFAYDDRIAADPSRCRRRVPLTRLATDVRADCLPDFAFIARTCATTPTTAACGPATGSSPASSPACSPRSARTASSSSPTTRATPTADAAEDRTAAGSPRSPRDRTFAPARR